MAGPDSAGLQVPDMVDRGECPDLDQSHQAVCTLPQTDSRLAQQVLAVAVDELKGFGSDDFDTDDNYGGQNASDGDADTGSEMVH